MRRIFSVEEHEAALSLVEPFQRALIACADAVNAGLADVEGVAVRIESCYRDPGEQARLWALGREQLGGRWSIVDRAKVVTHAPPGRSAHEYGEAAHLVLYDPATNAWLDDSHPRWRWLGRLVDEHGLEWGGTFRTPDGKPFYDAAHVESLTWRSRARALGWRGLHR